MQVGHTTHMPRPWIRRLPTTGACLLAVAALTACLPAPGKDDGKDTEREPAPWVRGTAAVLEVGSVDGGYVGLRVTEKKQLELLAISGRSGKVTHRKVVQPTSIDYEAGTVDVTLTAAGHAVAAEPSEFVVSMLDPTTFDREWGYRGSADDVSECGEHVCVAKPDDTEVVLAGDNGTELWETPGGVFPMGTHLIEFRAPDGGVPHFNGVTPDTGKARWRADPAKLFPNSDSYTFLEYSDDRGAFGGMTSSGRSQGFAMYDLDTGEKLWTRRSLLAWTTDGQLIGTHRRTVHFLDPETGETRWSARAPAGYRLPDDTDPLVVDAAGDLWLTLRKGSSRQLTFVPVDQDRERLGAVDPDSRHVVFTRAVDADPVDVRVKGKTYEFQPIRMQPVLAGTGEPTTWAGEGPLPTDLRGTDPHAAAIDADGHPILKRLAE